MVQEVPRGAKTPPRSILGGSFVELWWIFNGLLVEFSLIFDHIFHVLRIDVSLSSPLASDLVVQVWSRIWIDGWIDGCMDGWMHGSMEG